MGWLSGMVDSFTGKAQKRDIDAGIAASGQSRDQQISSIQSGGAEAQGYLAPWATAGRAGGKMYEDTLGIHGVGARGTAQDTYLSDDVLTRMRRMDMQASDRMGNAQGRSRYLTGAGALAGERVALQNYGNWQNRLQGVGQQGQQAAMGQADIAQRTGAGVAGAYGQYGANAAQLYGQRAAAENTMWQNIIGIGSVAASAYGSQAGNKNKLAGQQGNNIS